MPHPTRATSMVVVAETYIVGSATTWLSVQYLSNSKLLMVVSNLAITLTTSLPNTQLIITWPNYSIFHYVSSNATMAKQMIDYQSRGSSHI